MLTTIDVYPFYLNMDYWRVFMPAVKTKHFIYISLDCDGFSTVESMYLYHNNFLYATISKYLSRFLLLANSGKAN